MIPNLKYFTNVTYFEAIIVIAGTNKFALWMSHMRNMGLLENISYVGLKM